MNVSLTSGCGRSIGQERVLGLVLLALIWAQFFWALVPSWLELPIYRYALLGAPLVTYFAFCRWREAALVERVPPSRGLSILLVTLLGLGISSIVLVRPLERVDEFWRLPLWFHGMTVLAATAAGMILLEGWKRARLILPVFLFSLVLIPLPSAVENTFVGSLSGFISSAVGGLLPLAGYPIDRLGNAMLIRGAILDVADGCSGMRSFQASLMTGLLLGEFFRHGFVQRLALVGLAVLLAVIGNGARIFYLATVAFEDGMEAEARVHNTAGMISLLFIYGMIGVVGWALARDWRLARREIITRRVNA